MSSITIVADGKYMAMFACAFGSAFVITLPVFFYARIDDTNDDTLVCMMKWINLSQDQCRILLTNTSIEHCPWSDLNMSVCQVKWFIVK